MLIEPAVSCTRDHSFRINASQQPRPLLTMQQPKSVTPPCTVQCSYSHCTALKLSWQSTDACRAGQGLALVSVLFSLRSGSCYRVPIGGPIPKSQMWKKQLNSEGRGKLTGTRSAAASFVLQLSVHVFQAPDITRFSANQQAES